MGWHLLSPGQWCRCPQRDVLSVPVGSDVAAGPIPSVVEFQFSFLTEFCSGSTLHPGRALPKRVAGRIVLHGSMGAALVLAPTGACGHRDCTEACLWTGSWAESKSLHDLTLEMTEQPIKQSLLK